MRRTILQFVVGVVALVALAWAGAPVSVLGLAAEPRGGQQRERRILLSAQNVNKEDRGTATPGPAAEKPVVEDSKLRNLLKERVAVLKTVVKEMEASEAVGRTAPEKVLQARMEVLRAELELAASHKERIAIHERIVALAKELEGLAEKRRSVLSSVDLLRAKADRLEAEIALERAKAGATTAPK